MSLLVGSLHYLTRCLSSLQDSRHYSHEVTFLVLLLCLLTPFLLKKCYQILPFLTLLLPDPPVRCGFRQKLKIIKGLMLNRKRKNLTSLNTNLTRSLIRRLTSIPVDILINPVGAKQLATSSSQATTEDITDTGSQALPAKLHFSQPAVQSTGQAAKEFSTTGPNPSYSQASATYRTTGPEDYPQAGAYSELPEDRMIRKTVIIIQLLNRMRESCRILVKNKKLRRI